MYKYSHDNDDLINIAAEIEFVDTFLRGSTDLEQAKKQLEVLYGRERRLKECNEYISKGVVTQSRSMILTQLLLRNKLIVQRCFFAAKSRIEGVAIKTVNEQVDTYDDQILDYTMDIVKRVLDDASYCGLNETGTFDIFNLSKDMNLYRNIYMEYRMISDTVQKEVVKEKVFSYKNFSVKEGE